MSPRSIRGREAGFAHWLRSNLFSSPINAALTLIVAVCAGYVAMRLGNWLIFDAQWQGTAPQACSHTSGACWPFIHSRLGQLLYGLYPPRERWRVDIVAALAAGLGAAALARRLRGRVWAILLMLYPLAAVVLLCGGWFGLLSVATTYWGGLMLTLVVSGCTLAISLPAGVLLALGRNSELPLLRSLCAGWIELWRAVPVLVLLFVVIIMFPLFMPPGVEVDKLPRAILALCVVMSCYIAEAVRGALQGLGRSPYEASAALGLGYWQTMRFVILPQALKTATPQITSLFIGLFKETTLLLVIGFADLLGMVFAASSDPAWLAVGALPTGLAFAALFFWCCCFGLSRLSANLERRLGGAERARR
jgi:general L-amino acid transport system permease protein